MINIMQEMSTKSGMFSKYNLATIISAQRRGYEILSCNLDIYIYINYPVLYLYKIVIDI